MKSAYEIAMERFGNSTPTRKLSTRQKARLAELESVHRAQVAERELAVTEALEAAQAAGELEKAAQLRAEFLLEKKKLATQLEEKKEQVRAES